MNLDEIKNAEKNIIREFKCNKLRTVKEKLQPTSGCPRYSENHYIESYPSLCEVTQFLCEQVDNYDVSRGDAILSLANMAYGWMPAALRSCKLHCNNTHKQGMTILDAKGMTIQDPGNIKDDEEIIQFLNGYGNSPPITKNGSWIGLSKVLHFINPEVFPIWDSNVARNFYLRRKKNGESDTKYKNKVHAWANNKGRYICYIKWCHLVLNNSAQNAITIQNAVKKVRKLFSNKVGYQVSKIRALEFILFVLGQQGQNQ